MVIEAERKLEEVKENEGKALEEYIVSSAAAILQLYSLNILYTCKHGAHQI